MHLKYAPEFLKRHLRPLPQWVAIGTERPTNLVRVNLVAAGRHFDVTDNQVIAALRPLTVAIGLDASLQEALEQKGLTTLVFVDRHTLTAVASLVLQYKGTMTAQGGTRIGRFEILDGHERCVQAPYRLWNRWLQGRRATKAPRTNDFPMLPKTLQQIMILYTCPRPIVLVSVDDGIHRNLFPMDLIGPITPTVFTLALRTTSRSIETLKTVRKVALSNLATSDLAIAYKLGNQHKQQLLDWNELPFALRRSDAFSLPVPATALRIRELHITGYETIGSHTFFVCELITDCLGRTQPQLCHTSGLYHHYRSRKRLPLQRA